MRFIIILLSTFMGVLAQIQTYKYRKNKGVTKVNSYSRDFPSWVAYFVVWTTVYILLSFIAYILSTNF